MKSFFCSFPKIFLTSFLPEYCNDDIWIIKRTKLLRICKDDLYFRQSLLFSGTPCPDMNAIYNRHCFNYFGKARVINPVVSGAISKVIRYMKVSKEKMNE